jgi:hypothetical protein
MNKIPEQVVSKIRDLLWQRADEAEWISLPDARKAIMYEQWQRDPEVGGILSNYADVRNVRVYIKDSIMKPYARERLKDPAPILRLLSLPENSAFRMAPMIKPHGRILADGKTVCWGPAKDWKSILIATSERAFRHHGCLPYASVLIKPSGRLMQPAERAVVAHTADRLGIEKLIWS